MYMFGTSIGPVVDFQNQWLNLKKKNDRKISHPIKIKRFIVILVYSLNCSMFPLAFVAG